jgi:hypothetical protein
VSLLVASLSACGGGTSKKTNADTPASKKVDTLQVDAKTLEKTAVLPKKDTPTQKLRQSLDSTGQQGQDSQNQAALFQTSQGQLPQGQQPGQVGQGGQTFPSPAVALDVTFPKRVVGKPNEVIDLSDARFVDAQPRTTSVFHVGGVHVPAGTRVEGHMNLTKGTASAFVAHRLVLSDGRAYLVQGGGWVASKEEQVTSANLLNIVAGAVVGAGAAALFDSLFGANDVNGWALGAGAVVGGVLGWQLFPNREDVVLVEQAAAARLVLEARP